jgi:hypothetical protein
MARVQQHYWREIMNDKSEEVSKAMAKYFYEQCAGTYSGHMANVANNPVLFGIIGAHTDQRDNCYAASQAVFADFLRRVAANS